MPAAAARELACLRDAGNLLGTDDEKVKCRLPPVRGDDGQTMPEYAVILAVITPAIAIAVVLLGDTAGAAIARVASLFPV